jgi:hypothetical protein
MRLWAEQGRWRLNSDILALGLDSGSRLFTVIYPLARHVDLNLSWNLELRHAADSVAIRSVPFWLLLGSPFEPAGMRVRGNQAAPEEGAR